MVQDLPPRWLTIQEAADILRVSTRTIRKWIKAGELQAKKIGGVWRIRRKEVE